MGTFQPSKTGQILVPLWPRAIEGLDAQAIADEVAPAVIEAAAAQGGAPIGAPELLTEDELRDRIDDPDLVAAVDAAPGRLWLVATMVPLDEANRVARGRPDAGVSEIVLPPVRLRRGRRGRG